MINKPSCSVSDINECDDPVLASRCVPNAECCNLPAHYLCRCLPGFQGDGEEECVGKTAKEDNAQYWIFHLHLINSCAT